ncbi:MAG: 1-deoxy-D-xylulose-5-phosphate synthase, partial [Proteobacteria bacterium]|nr:1-deoxy-D-xylulose-5-phosphate synthase [Pseudomonadota bacterium]
LHYVFDAPEDKIIFDVGHQSYTHKIITGRREAFKNLRKYKGLSGFTNRNESDYDPFGAGHVGTAISSALGFAISRDLKGEKNKVIAVVGDGGLTAGISYEGLNNAGFLNRDFVVVLNDNEMSIDKNIGGIAKYLARITASSEYYSVKSGIWNFVDKITNHNEKVIKFMKRAKESAKRLFVEAHTIFFEEFGFHYMGPYNGHKLGELIEVFKFVKNLNEPVFVHVITEKGKGYKKAEEDPTRFHGLGPFNIESGKVDKPENSRPKYTSIFSDKMVDIGEKHTDVIAITAAMPQGTGLVKFRERFADRFFDVGIAEQHAVTFAGGLAAGGMHPFVAIYSTFLELTIRLFTISLCRIYRLYFVSIEPE